MRPVLPVLPHILAFGCQDSWDQVDSEALADGLLRNTEPLWELACVNMACIPLLLWAAVQDHHLTKGEGGQGGREGGEGRKEGMEGEEGGWEERGDVKEGRRVARREGSRKKEE